MQLLSWLRRKPSPPTVPPVVPVRKLSYQCSAVQGIGARENQEDAYTLVNATDVTKIRAEGLLALVADGMGGLECGEVASQLGIRVITEDFLRMDRGAPLEPQLRDSVLHAAQQVYTALQGAGGSTIIACIVYDEHLYYAGLGDSFLYLLRNGKLIRINREHNLRHSHYLRCIHSGCVDSSAHGEISQPQAVTNFMGMEEVEEIDWFSKAMPLLDDDVLLLCSDGVAGALQPREITACFDHPDANDAAAMLRNIVISKNLTNQDNFTAVVIRCKK